MKSDAITQSHPARRQSARKEFGVGRKSFVGPDFFVKDKCREATDAPTAPRPAQVAGCDAARALRLLRHPWQRQRKYVTLG
jgi:hypothetical protein